MSVQLAKLENLTKDNYASWKYKFMLFLKAEELWHIVVKKMQLKEQLQNVKMDRNMTILDYVGRIRGIVEDLTLRDCNVDVDYIVCVCLKGLPSNFNMFKTSIYVAGIPSFDDLIPKLLQEQ